MDVVDTGFNKLNLIQLFFYKDIYLLMVFDMGL